MTEPQKIYFDESGFTGNNLLHPEQKYFAYASVATNDDDAKEFVEHLISKYRVQGGEIKGSKLLKFSRGRKLIDEVLDRYSGNIKVSISDKKFALACKFFEYIFEPTISDINSIFYGIGFHKFIANVLYLEFCSRGSGAEQIFEEFEQLMRSGGGSSLGNIFSSSVHPENSRLITHIREFAQHKSEDIRDELASLGESGSGKWILDLTNTSLYTLLANWGTEYPELTAICDPSKPLQHDPSFFDKMIGRDDGLFSTFGNEEHPITFNLSGPIVFADSKVTHGIQIADAVAAAAVHVFSSPNDDDAKQWRSKILPFAAYGSVMPDLDELQIHDFRVRRNAVLLAELHARATAGASLTEGMPQYIRSLSPSAMLGLGG
ncbi:DUF3800 domain-containing protein [Pandoraea sputorum]|uniref:DUF3800 domain-containing protein n=1 Tax=Pandoraea sputorum TaxID=93222 RepID=UPI001E336463|nr:DUF3800 domain-containing protein [Pandoraea sputorum]MCE4059882.1 DUF3800 domain-containing protein [Pandoraea sputorum]